MAKNRTKRELKRLEKENAAGILYDPGPSAAAVITGSLCRFLVALAGAYGICLMMNDSFHFTGSLDMLRVFLLCLGFGAIAYLVSAARNVSRVFYVVTVVALVAVFALSFTRQSLETFFIYAPLTAWNHAIKTLSDTGFSSLSYFYVNVKNTNPTALGADEKIALAFKGFCAIVSFAFVHSTVKRMRLMPPVIFSAAVMTVCFTYNMINENFGFLFLVCAAIGMLTLKYCDARIARKYKADGKKKDKLGFFKRTARSGAAGFLAAALAFSVGAYPAAKIKEPVNEIKAIESFIQAAREFLYDYISGEKLTGSSYTSLSSSSTSVKPDERNFENVKLFDLRSYTNVPVYLRAWVGGSYSHGKWMIASPAGYEEGSDYTPEYSTELFYDVLGINENRIANDVLLDKSNADYGFITSYVSLGNLGFGTDMFCLPSRYSPYYGIMEYAKTPSFVPTATTYTVRHNGMITLPKMGVPSYSTVAHLPYYQSEGLIRTVNAATDEFLFTVKSLNEYVFVSDDYPNVGPLTIELIEKRAEDEGITLSRTNVIRYLASLSDPELETLRQRIVSYDIERATAYSYYLNIPESETGFLSRDAETAVGEELLKKLLGKPDYYDTADGTSVMIEKGPDHSFGTLYSAVYRVVSYIAEAADYTLEPYGYKSNQSYVYQFLHTAKNGYCTQYATAAVLLLRSLGIPARYVEGFKTSYFEPKGNVYRSIIRDSDAHSWIEVYIDGVGWTTFEATEPMLSSMYGEGPANILPPDDTGADTFAPPVTVEPVTHQLVPGEIDTAKVTDTEPVTEDPGVITDPGFKIPPALIVAAAILFVLLSAAFAYLTYRKKQRGKLISDLEAAAKGDVKDPYADTVRFCGYIFKVLAALGYERGENELMSDFAKRITSGTNCKWMKAAADAAQKTAFAGKADEKDCQAAANCALALQTTARNRLRGFDRFFYITLRKLV